MIEPRYKPVDVIRNGEKSFTVHVKDALQDDPFKLLIEGWDDITQVKVEVDKWIAARQAEHEAQLEEAKQEEKKVESEAEVDEAKRLLGII